MGETRQKKTRKEECNLTHRIVLCDMRRKAQTWSQLVITSEPNKVNHREGTVKKTGKIIRPGN